MAFCTLFCSNSENSSLGSIKTMDILTILWLLAQDRFLKHGPLLHNARCTMLQCHKTCYFVLIPDYIKKVAYLHELSSVVCSKAIATCTLRRKSIEQQLIIWATSHLSLWWPTRIIISQTKAYRWRSREAMPLRARELRHRTIYEVIRLSRWRLCGIRLTVSNYY